MKSRPEFKETRKKEASQRNEAWAKLTPAEQLEELDKRLGKGNGAKRQRARIAKALAK